MRTAPNSPAWSTRITCSTSVRASRSPGLRVPAVFTFASLRLGPDVLDDVRAQQQREAARADRVPARHRDAEEDPGRFVAADHLGAQQIFPELLDREAARDSARAGLWSRPPVML